jgi:ketosteroid isomerase-like protein
MSQENAEIVRSGYEHVTRTGDLPWHLFAPDLVWDMSKFVGWLERPVYEGIKGVRDFSHEWADAWDDWTIDVLALHDAGDKIVAVVHQHGRAKATGIPVDMVFAQVWSLRDGKEVRMEGYADAAEALKAVGLAE